RGINIDCYWSGNRDGHGIIGGPGGEGIVSGWNVTPGECIGASDNCAQQSCALEEFYFGDYAVAVPGVGCDDYVRWRDEIAVVDGTGHGDRWWSVGRWAHGD